MSFHLFTNKKKLNFVLLVSGFIFANQSVFANTNASQLQSIATTAQKNTAQAKQQAAQFRGTPLEAYASFQYLKNTTQDPKYTHDIINYLNKFSETSWANTLAQSWSAHLVKQQDWNTLVITQDALRKGGARCAVLAAQYQIGFYHQENWVKEVSYKWLTDDKPTQNCQYLYNQFEQSSWVTEQQWQQKLNQLYVAGQLEQANQKQGAMPANVLAYHQQVYGYLTGNLEQAAHSLAEQSAVPQQTQVFLVVIQQLIPKNAMQAYSAWTKAKPNLTNVSSLQLHQIEKQIYRQLAKDDKENQLNWLAKIDNSVQEDATFIPVFQQAIRTSDWQTLLKLTSNLPTSMQKDAWQYWHVKALTELGRKQEALPLWQELAKVRSYYGFMAADYLGTSYHLNTKQVTAEQIQRARNNPLSQRMQALYQIGLKTEAWREWNHQRAHNQIPADDIPGFSQLAHTWGWYPFAIMSLGRSSEHWDYTQQRFSMPYDNLILPNAKLNQISPAWAYAIMRRESAYSEDVKSSAGAMGLMQLMPKTAKSLATIKNINNVYQPALNVQLGTKLLGQLERQFEGNIALASASYNAGAFRVKQWLKNQPTLPADQWIEIIPFKETREYVKAVLEYMLVFERQGVTNQSTRLADYIQPFDKQLANAGPNCDPKKSWCL